jgi:hypothetical protein
MTPKISRCVNSTRLLDNMLTFYRNTSKAFMITLLKGTGLEPILSKMLVNSCYLYLQNYRKSSTMDMPEGL